MSCSKWHEYTLDELVEIIGGGTPKTSIEEYWNGDINWISIKDFNGDNKYITNTEKTITELGLNKSSTKLLKCKDIIISARGTVGALGVIKKPMAFNQSCYGLRAKELVDSDFLYYLLKNCINILKNNTHGSVFNTITKDTFKNIKVLIPDKNYQIQISRVLSKLDEKIELNNEMNKTLEEMAQALFKRWFVDFEFPNEEGKPYKSSGGEMVESEMGMIPKGWSIISLSQIVDTFNGYSYKGKELLDSKDALVTIKNFDRNGGYKIDGLKQIVISDRVKEHHYVDLNDIVVAHTDLTQNAEIIGNPIMILSKGRYDKLIISMDTVKVKSKQTQYSNSIIYYILKDKRFKNFAKSHTKGTTVLHLPKDTILNYRIALPCNESIIIQLGDMLSRLIEKIKINYNENENLIELRDSLLPKLMSGEIRVDDIEANL